MNTQVKHCACTLLLLMLRSFVIASQGHVKLH